MYVFVQKMSQFRDDPSASPSTDLATTPHKTYLDVLHVSRIRRFEWPSIIPISWARRVQNWARRLEPLGQGRHGDDIQGEDDLVETGP